MRNVVFLLLVLFIFTTSSFAATKLIINNRVFSLQENQKPTCGQSKGDPEYSAALMLMLTAQGLGEQTGGTKSGIESIFRFIREYPSRFTADTCALLRDVCESKCLKSAFYTVDECKIECNQYESWNR